LKIRSHPKFPILRYICVYESEPKLAVSKRRVGTTALCVIWTASILVYELDQGSGCIKKSPKHSTALRISVCRSGTAENSLLALLELVRHSMGFCRRLDLLKCSANLAVEIGPSPPTASCLPPANFRSHHSSKRPSPHSLAHSLPVLRANASCLVAHALSSLFLYISLRFDGITR
jgi:hypothetical protein